MQLEQLYVETPKRVDIGAIFINKPYLRVSKKKF
jgi:hypothetical protein